jgi:hypothetical protein
MKRLLLIMTSIVLLAILVAAGIVAWQLLGPPAQRATASEEPAVGAGQRVIAISRDTGDGPISVRIFTEPAKELPDRPADSGGAFLRREDDSIFVGTGNITLDVEVDSATGVNEVNLSSDGPEVEVVVTRDTVLYEDITDLDEAFADGESGDKILQQHLRPGSLEDVGENMEIQVWGARQGDRIIGDVLVYRMPDV